MLTDGAVGYGRFTACTRTDRHTGFEFVLLPLIHTGDTINRILGAITAIEAPFWLGAEPLIRQEIVELNLHWPDGAPAFVPDCPLNPSGNGGSACSTAERKGRSSRSCPDVRLALPNYETAGPGAAGGGLQQPWDRRLGGRSARPQTAKNHVLFSIV